jgi:hypothetical protein
MSTPDHYRAKALEYARLAKSCGNPDEMRGYRLRAASLTTLADNVQWLAEHRDKTLHAPLHGGAIHSDLLAATEDSNDASEGGVRGNSRWRTFKPINNQ